MRETHPESPPTRTVAVIGSFKQFYPEVLAARRAFEEVGLTVTSPVGTAILQPDIDFVRFASDDVRAEDHLVQTRTLALILRSDAVFVVAPEGYIGRTTCYEVGRVRQAHVPLYFSEHPRDLPILVPTSQVVSAPELAHRLSQAPPQSWNYSDEGEASEIEMSLLGVSKARHESG